MTVYGRISLPKDFGKQNVDLSALLLYQNRFHYTIEWPISYQNVFLGLKKPFSDKTSLFQNINVY